MTQGMQHLLWRWLMHGRNCGLLRDHDAAAGCPLATLATGFSGADLSNVVNEAAFLAARSATEAVGLPELVEAVQRTR